MPGDIIVRVGGALDRSYDTMWSQAEDRNRRAFETMRQSGKRGTSAVQAESSSQIAVHKLTAAQQIAIAKSQYQENSKLNRAMAVEQLRTERALAMQQAQIGRERTKERLAQLSVEEKAEAQHAARLQRMKLNSAREANRVQRQAEREHLREQYAQSREIDRFATRTSHRATRFFFPRPEGALGYGKRLAGDLARGVGIDTSLSGGVARARERESAGMGLAQQERIAEGGKSRGGAFWAGKSLEVGTALKADPAEVTEMMRAFTGKTGDFKAAAEQAKELASMTLASGANMGEMGNAAGYVYNQLKGMPDAAARTLDVMRGIVGQTAVGAVEMEEYAKQMGRIAANAKMFQGDVSKNILELSALTQLSIAEGGATSGADAARSIAAFANTTSKGMRINAFKKQGIDLFNEGGTQKRPILDIIKDSLIKSKGSIPEMTKMWADTLGQKPIRGLTNAFNAAGGGEKGWEAALAKIKPFMDAQLDKETERKNIEDRNQTMAARAQDFQNKLDQITTSLANRLLPTLEELAPKLLQLSSAFADVVAWAAANPWKAVMAGAGVAIGRALAESGGRMLLERGLNGIHGAGGMGAPIGAITGAGAVTSALGALALGAATFTITTAVLNASNVSMQEDKKSRAVSYNQTYQDFASEYTNAKTPEEREAALKRARSNVQNVHESRGGFMNAISEDEDQKSTMAAIAKLVQTVTKGGEQPWQPGDLRASTAKEVTAQEIGANVATAMKTTQLQISGWDTLIDAIGKMGQIGNGAGGFGSPGSMGGPPVANQF
jgi:hypothetical protein